MTTKLKERWTWKEEVPDRLQIKALREKTKEQTLKDLFIVKKPQISGFKKTLPVYNAKLSVISKGNSTEPIFLKSAVLKVTINVSGMKEVSHIANVNLETLWVSDYESLKRIDFAGSVIETVGDADSSNVKFTVTKDGNLLYVRQGSHSIQKRTSNRTSVLLYSQHELIKCIYSSNINGDLLVGKQDVSTHFCKLTRYDRAATKIQDIESDMHGEMLYAYPRYITENINGDIVTSDSSKKAVVVVDKRGRHRFNYIGPSESSFLPVGICTDVYAHILVADCNDIHVISKDGLLLTLLLTGNKQSTTVSLGLCVDDNHNLYAGSEHGTIKVYKYLKHDKK